MGKQFGRLVAIQRVGADNNGLSLWRCRCSCGAERVVRLGSLSSGVTRSCGQHRTAQTAQGEAGFRRLLGAYRVNAKRREHTFALAEDVFRALVTGNCHYCGQAPSNVSEHSAGRVTAATRANSTFLYNGIDRLDTARGYEADNVVTCCATCNRAKLAMTYDEFVSWLRRVHRHLSLASIDNA